ncbi:T-complex protein 1 subunit beta [Camellia lanceoleosa]|uniref:T-complex protein 1 subunit beta n=1 Tax=Camellia lanceoleosa TaxID=1840588 RepID=A0ACC0IRU2_9ERIC|nr:T-complex protein 1 subunit beta [Camellia lanceoleosa]
MGQACTIVLRSASNHVLDEAERSLHDALCVLSVDELAWKTPGKKSHAIEAFSRALLAIPTIILDDLGQSLTCSVPSRAPQGRKYYRD